MGGVCSHVDLVTEFESKIDKNIRFLSTQGRFCLRELPSLKKTYVNIHKLKELCGWNSSIKILVYLDGKSTNITLTPQNLLSKYVRVVFEYDFSIVPGRKCLVVKGLVEQKGDLLPRLRCMDAKRSKIYNFREATRGLQVIGTAVVEDKKVVTPAGSQKENVIEAVEVVTDNSVDNQILDSTSTEQVISADYPITCKLTYLKPSMMSRGIRVGEISNNDVDKDQVQILKGVLIGFIGDDISGEHLESRNLVLNVNCIFN